MTGKSHDIKGLIFDKDGTLFDFATTWEAWAAAFLLRICEGDRARAARVAMDIGFDLEAMKFDRKSIVIAGTPDDVAAALLPHFPQMTAGELRDILNEEAERAPQREAVPLMPLLTSLRQRGLRLGVATNDAEIPARAHLAQFEVTSLFDFIAGSDSGHGCKPGFGQLQAFSTLVGLPGHSIAMVGDSTHDLRAGRAMGMVSVAVLTGLASHDELAPFADVILPDIGHLPAWLDGEYAGFDPTHAAADKRPA